MKVNGVEVKHQTLPELLINSATDASSDAGVEVDGRFLTYRELHELAIAMAGNLQARGLKPGDRVCSLIQNRIEVLVTWFGTVMAGGIWVPVNVGLIGKDLAYTISDAAPMVFIVEAALAERVVDLAVSPRLPNQRFVIGQESRLQGFEPYEALLDSSHQRQPVEIAPSDPAVIIYTGGTTGLPKGVVLPHFAMVCGAMRYIEVFGATTEDRHFSVSPLFHTGGLTISVLGPMMAGMRTTIGRTFSLSKYWSQVRASGATIINPMGVILTLLCREPPSSSDRDHRVRACLGLTAQLPEEIPQEFSRRFGIEIARIYALSETSGAMTVYNTLGSPCPESNGRASHWVDIVVVDALDQPLPANQTGQILLRPKVPHTFMLRYHNNDAATVRVWSNLWLHTGDLGYMNEDGYLFFCGREAHWLRRRGENISAYEVESIIGQYPGIKELAIVGQPSELGEEDVKVFVVLEDGVTLDPVKLTSWCAERMAGFKVPRYVEAIGALPRSTAKREIERHILRAMPNGGAWDREKVFGRQLPRPQVVPS